MYKTYNLSELSQVAQTQSHALATHRHPHYTKVCEYIATRKLCNGDKLPSCRTIASELKIGKSCVNSHLQELINNGWVRKIVDGYSWRSIRYYIVMTRNEAEHFMKFLATLPPKKKKRSLSNAYCNSDIGIKFGHWGRATNGIL